MSEDLKTTQKFTDLLDRLKIEWWLDPKNSKLEIKQIDNLKLLNFLKKHCKNKIHVKITKEYINFVIKCEKKNLKFKIFFKSDSEEIKDKNISKKDLLKLILNINDEIQEKIEDVLEKLIDGKL